MSLESVYSLDWFGSINLSEQGCDGFQLIKTHRIIFFFWCKQKEILIIVSNPSVWIHSGFQQKESLEEAAKAECMSYYALENGSEDASEFILQASSLKAGLKIKATLLKTDEMFGVLLENMKVETLNMKATVKHQIAEKASFQSACYLLSF